MEAQHRTACLRQDGGVTDAAQPAARRGCPNHPVVTSVLADLTISATRRTLAAHR